jgi:hypothetical protein
MGRRCLAASNFAQPRGHRPSGVLGASPWDRGASRSAPSLRDAADARASGGIPFILAHSGRLVTCHFPPACRVSRRPSPRSPPPGTLPGEPWDRVREAPSPTGRDGLPVGHASPERRYRAGTVCGPAQVPGATDRPRGKAGERGHPYGMLREASRSACWWAQTGDRVRLEREPISSSLQGDIPCYSVDVDREVLIAGSGGRRGKDAGAASRPQGVGQGAASFQFFGIVASEKGGRWRNR